MIFTDKLKELLMENGLSSDDADKVMKLVVNDPVNKAMEGRWHEDVSGYPPAIINLMWMSTKPIALKWIDDNCPLAWFRPMFDDEQMAEINK